MHRKHETQLGVLAAQLKQGFADVFQSLTEVFSPVGGDQDHILIREEVGGLALIGMLCPFLPDQADGVDDGVAAQCDVFRRYAFGEQVAAGLHRRREMPARQTRDHGAVDFFRERAVGITGAQSGFDVCHRDALVKGCQRSGKRCRGVALHHHHVGSVLLVGEGQVFDQAGGEFRQGLVLAHQVQVDVGLEAKTRQRLVQHLAVLPGGAAEQLDTVQVARRLDHGRELDDFRPGAKNNHEFHRTRPSRSMHRDWPLYRTCSGQGEAACGRTTRNPSGVT